MFVSLIFNSQRHIFVRILSLVSSLGIVWNQQFYTILVTIEFQAWYLVHRIISLARIWAWWGNRNSGATGVSYGAFRWPKLTGYGRLLQGHLQNPLVMYTLIWTFRRLRRCLWLWKTWQIWGAMRCVNPRFFTDGYCFDHGIKFAMLSAHKGLAHSLETPGFQRMCSRRNQIKGRPKWDDCVREILEAGKEKSKSVSSRASSLADGYKVERYEYLLPADD